MRYGAQSTFFQNVANKSKNYNANKDFPETSLKQKTMLPNSFEKICADISKTNLGLYKQNLFDDYK